MGLYNIAGIINTKGSIMGMMLHQENIIIIVKTTMKKILGYSLMLILFTKYINKMTLSWNYNECKFF